MKKPILNLCTAKSKVRHYYFIVLNEFFEIVRMEAGDLQDVKVLSHISDPQVRGLIIVDEPKYGDMKVVQYGHFEIILDYSSDCAKVEKFLCELGIRSVIDKSEYKNS